MLALLPFDPGTRVVARCEPGVDGFPEVGLPAQPPGERELDELDAEAGAQIAKAFASGSAPTGHRAGSRRSCDAAGRARAPRGSEACAADQPLSAAAAPTVRVRSSGISTTLPEVCEGLPQTPPNGGANALAQASQTSRHTWVTGPCRSWNFGSRAPRRPVRARRCLRGRRRPRAARRRQAEASRPRGSSCPRAQ